jgi:hypothetical protein
MIANSVLCQTVSSIICKYDVLIWMQINDVERRERETRQREIITEARQNMRSSGYVGERNMS